MAGAGTGMGRGRSVQLAPLLVTEAEAALLRRVMHHRIVGPGVRSDTIDLTVIAETPRRHERGQVAGGGGIVYGRVKLAGGGPGSLTEDCDYNYDVWRASDWDGTGTPDNDLRIMTGFPPLYGRLDNTPYNAAEDGSLALIYAYADGSYDLVWALGETESAVAIRPVLVALKKVSGSAGDASNPASWAYDGWHPVQYDTSSLKLFAALQPSYGRTAVGPYDYAPNQSTGIAAVDPSTGDWVLLQALAEVPQQLLCDCGA